MIKFKDSVNFADNFTLENYQNVVRFLLTVFRLYKSIKPEICLNFMYSSLQTGTI